MASETYIFTSFLEFILTEIYFLDIPWFILTDLTNWNVQLGNFFKYKKQKTNGEIFSYAEVKLLLLLFSLLSNDIDDSLARVTRTCPETG